MEMGLELKLAYEDQEEIRKLFTEYTDMLVEGDAAIKEYLGIQNYGRELEHLEDKYGLPDGRLYLALYDGLPAGCIGLRRLDAENCELKRVYVRPEFRGHQIGRSMIGTILEDAVQIGYKAMYLDTLPFLQSALRLYEKLGFYETGAYNDSPIASTIFMKKDLQPL